FASAMALSFMDRPKIELWRVNLGGLLIAVGIGTMHYAGMEAMRMNCVMVYSLPWFVVSILVAHVLAATALFIKFYFSEIFHQRALWAKLGSAVVMGSAVGCMHYTAMHAARFYPGEAMHAPSMLFDPNWLGLAIGIVTSLIMGIAIVCTIVDRHFAAISNSLSQSQRRTHLIIESAPQAFISVGPDGAIQDWNPQARANFGWSREEALGLPFVDTVFPEGSRAEFRRRIDQALQSDGGIDDLGRELTVVRRNGSEFPAEITFGRLQEGQFTLLTAFLQDITERKWAEKTLIEAMEAAQTATRAKSAFLANMSHEIRTPMNGIIGMTELLIGSELTREQHEYADAVQRSAEALMTIINDILDFSKIEAGRIELETVDFDVRATIEEVCELLAVRAEEKKLELMCQVNGTVPAMLHGDPGRLRQILLNLVSNALKFTEKGEVLISVGLIDQLDRKATLEFAVSDTGIGIPSDRLTKIFESFTQADASTTRQYGGTGLGLTISKSLVELMGGNLYASSFPNQGSTFTFRIPFAESESQPRPRFDAVTFDGQRALIVDDNETNRRILHERLTRFGFPHEEAPCAEIALESLRAAALSGRPFTIALVDYQMPQVDGLMLCEQIKSDPTLQNTKLVVLTSVGQKGEVREFASKGIVAYLVKPLKQSLLFDCLVELTIGAPVKSGDAPILTQYVIRERRRARAISVLLVEDNAINQRVAQSMLKKLGYNCDLSNNGREALEAVENHPYDLILMDCQMPEMDGYEATREIRRLEGATRHTPIVAMTANAMQGDRERCLEAGMDDYVAKPVKSQELANAISRALDSAGRVPEIGVEAFTEDGVVFDSKELLDRLDGDEALYGELVVEFLSSLPSDIEDLKQSGDDLAKFARLAHALKGSAGNMGAKRLSSLASNMESAAKEGDAIKTNELLCRIGDEVERLREALQAAT
ncbi:MAG: response regulator, partial [Candidatus Hydrogenedentota bacterium]